MEPLAAIGWLLALGAGAFALTLHGRVRALEAALEASARQLQEQSERGRRALEDHQAAAERQRRQALDEARFAHEPLVRAVLPVLDDLDRALAACGQAEEDPLARGVGMVRSRLEQALGRHGVEWVEAAGRPFDPQAHEAVDLAPSAEVPPDHVLSQWSRGARLHGRLVAAARVVVARAPEAPVAEAEEVRPEDRGAPGGAEE